MPYPNQRYSTWIDHKSNCTESISAIEQPKGSIIKVLPFLLYPVHCSHHFPNLFDLRDIIEKIINKIGLKNAHHEVPQMQFSTHQAN